VTIVDVRLFFGAAQGYLAQLEREHARAVEADPRRRRGGYVLGSQGNLVDRLIETLN
jgi:hypothetical protein